MPEPAAATGPAGSPATPQPYDSRGCLDWVYLAVIFGVALALRLTYFYLNRQNNPAFEFPILDSLDYHEWAKEIISGKFWGDEVFFRGPLYPYWLAFLYKLSGSSIAFAVFWQHVTGSLTCGLVYLLACEYFSKKVSLTAGLIAALYWTFIYFESELLIVTSLLFLDTFMLLLLARTLKRNGAILPIAAGIVLGLSAIARPSVLIFAPAIPLVFYATRPGDGSSKKRFFARWPGRTLVVFAAALMVILPVTVRNYIIGGAVVPIASSGGVNFYIGNNPSSDGRTAIVPGTSAPWLGGNEEAVAMAERAAGKKLNPAQVSSFYFRRGLDFILSQPGQAALLFLKKLRLFWSSEERSNDKFIYFFWYLSGLGRFPLPGFWLITPLALLGMGFQWKRRRELSLLYLFALTYMLGVVAFFINARFRLPVVPVLIIFSAFAMHHLVVLFSRNKKRLLVSALVLAVFALAVNYDFFTIRRTRNNHLAISHYTLGSAYLQQNQKDKAIAQYSIAREMYRQYPTPSYQLVARDVDYKLGALYWEKDDCDRTVEVLRGVRGSDEKSLAVMNLLGDCYFKLNQLDRSIQVFQEILRIHPGHSPALTGLARAYGKTGRLEEAESILVALIRKSSQAYPPAYMALAGIRRESGKLDEAIQLYSVILRHPGYEREAHLSLSEAYVDKGDLEKALQTLKEARRYFPPSDTTLEEKINVLRRRP